MSNNTVQTFIELEYIKLMERNTFNFEDIRSAWFAGIAYEKYLSKKFKSDDSASNFWTWAYDRFLDNRAPIIQKFLKLCKIGV